VSKDAVEPIEEFPKQPLARFLGPEQQAGQCRAEGERVERREKHRNRDGDGELLVEPPGDSGDKRCGHEYRRQNQRDADHRAGQFFHGFEGRIPGSQALLDVPLYSLDHHDRVIHHEADRQDETEQREGVDGEAERGEKDECADERDGHCEQRNQVARQPCKKM